MTGMTRTRDFSGLVKAAFGPYYGPVGPQGTVGDFMAAWNSDRMADTSARRDAFDRINRAGLDVKQPASRIPYVLGGGAAARMAAKYLGFGPFWTNAATAAGALYGNSMFNRRNPDPHRERFAPGLVRIRA